MPRGLIICLSQMLVFTASPLWLTAYACPYSAHFLSSASVKCSFWWHFLNGSALS